MELSAVENKDIFYIYIYLDTRKPQVFTYGEYSFFFEPMYVGKGCNERWKRHLLKTNIKYDKNVFKNRIIDKIIEETCEEPIIIKIKSNLSEIESYELEKHLIKTIGRRDKDLGPLTNLTDGGDGPVGQIISEERRKQISKQMKGNTYTLGFKHTEKTKEKIRNLWKGKIHPNKNLIKSLETIEKIKIAATKHNYIIKSPEGEIFITRLLPDFCIINNLIYTTMLKVAKGKQYSHRGWIVYIKDSEFLREEIELERKNIKQNNLSRIYNLTASSPEGIFYENIISLPKFCKELKLNYNSVCGCRKLGKSYKGWQFFKESI